MLSWGAAGMRKLNRSMGKDFSQGIKDYCPSIEF
jgi:hypothetical protein